MRNKSVISELEENKKKRIKQVLGIALAVGLLMCQISWTAYADTTQTDNDIVYGADIGWLSQMEANGIQYLNEEGNVDDALEILSEKGVTAVRLRVFVNPESDFEWTKDDGTTCYLGYCDTQGLLYSAQRADALGMKIMLVFHYSDHFADPLCQDIPEQWEDATATELQQYVYDYTYYIMNLLDENGINPEWVQVGNEVSYGVLYPYGSNQTNDFTQLTAYLNSGYDAVKAVSPSSKVVTHLTHGSGISHFEWFFSNFFACGGRTDVIGLSYYPYWTGGDEIENVAINMYNMAATYDKEIMICETGEVETDPSKTYSLLRKEINALNALPDNKGIGVFYWEPEANSEYLPDEYSLGATTEVSENVLQFTSALNAFSTGTEFLYSECTYALYNVNSEKVLNVVSGSSENSALTEQYEYDSWDSQKWTFEEVDGSYYIIKNENSGLVLDVNGLSTSSGASVIQYEYNQGWNQMWKVIEKSDGSYCLKNRLSGLYLGIASNATTDGANCVQLALSEDSTSWYLIVTE